MADSTVADVSKLKVVELRKELKSRGLSYNGDKAELVTRLQNAIAQDDQGEITLDSDEIDSDGVLDDDDEKHQTDILDDSGMDALNEELGLNNQITAENISIKQTKSLKRKIHTEPIKDENDDSKNCENKEQNVRKIVLNRTTSIPKPSDETSEVLKETNATDKKPPLEKVKITAEIDPKTRLEMRAKRFGLPIKMTEAERKEARMKRFGSNASGTTTVNTSPGSLSENFEKLKKRAERFGQSVSKIMTDIEKKEKLEKRKSKFGLIN